MYKFWKKKTLSDTKRDPLRIFSLARKVFDIFFVIPPLRFNKNFARDKWSMPEISRNTQNFSETKKLCAKIVIPLMYNIFRYQKLSETPKDPLTTLFGIVGEYPLNSVLPPQWFTKCSRPTDGQLRFWADISLLWLWFENPLPDCISAVFFQVVYSQAIWR